MDINISFQLAVDHYLNGNLHQSESLCRQIIKGQPNHVDALNLLGLVCYCLANYDCAIHSIQRALELNPDNAEASTNLGNAYKQNGQSDLAAASYKRAIKLNPYLAMAHNNLGSVYQGKGRLDEAADCYQKALTIDPKLDMAYNNMGSVFLIKKEIEKAIPYFRKTIEINPNHAEAYYNLASALQEKGLVDDAIRHFRKTLALNLNIAGLHNHLGLAFQKKGDIDRAITHFKKALELDPHDAEGYYNLGLAFHHKKQSDDTIACYQKSIQLKPDYIDAHINLGIALREKGRPDEAITLYQKVLLIKPNHPKAYRLLGNALSDKGHLDEAITLFRKALQLDPDYPEAYSILGNALFEKGLFDEAITNYKKAIDLNPDFADAYLNLGVALQAVGKRDEAIMSHEKAVSLNPHDFRARLAHCISQLPIMYSEHAQIQIRRDHYRNELIQLQDSVSFSNPEDIRSAADAVGSQQPFYLAYQGLNDRELQDYYGKLICRIMSLRYPQFADKPAMPSHMPGEPLRVGVASGFFNLHSNWKIPIKGWVDNIDRRRFSFYGYYTGNKKDKATEDARISFTRFVEDINSFEELCRIIREDHLHMLIYPEIGMNPKSMRLAALRLAPVQCTSWGHPDTSGLPTIDYFISSDLMEPPDADDHYTETLIRLPNLSIHYTPLDIAPADINRKTLGLRRESVLYLCCQSLFKYLPQDDEIYPRIAKEVRDCQFLFISHKSRHVTEQFRRRINQSFNEFGLKADHYVVFLPRLDEGKYSALNALSDIFLDSIGWSGCNSALEAIAHDLPIVTLPGKLMRGRHSAAILAMMGTPDTIASTIDEYIALAVRLGSDSAWRKQVSQKTAGNKHRLYRDTICITALEDFIEAAVEGQLK
jgi:protein O-GlcNAc transferase